MKQNEIIFSEKFLTSIKNSIKVHCTDSEWFRMQSLAIDNLLLESKEMIRFVLEGVASFNFPLISMGRIDSKNLVNLNEVIVFLIYQKLYFPGAKLLDLGANIGLHSIIGAKIGYQVSAFEPDPFHARVFMNNIELNNVTERIDLIPAAISTKNGTSRFIRVEENSTSSHLTGSIGKKIHGPISEFEVQTKEFNQVLEQGFDLVKMDVEGYEAILFESLDARILNSSDFVVEIGSYESAVRVFEKLNECGVIAYSQKIGWEKVVKVSDMPNSYKQGSLFIAGKTKASCF